nr:uncharacterized protein LOC109153947 [Ipomoea batatas]GMD55864.1 uncharacterized protein LOC109153947 [Ipomoea batatas]
MKGDIAVSSQNGQTPLIQKLQQIFFQASFDSTLDLRKVKMQRILEEISADAFGQVELDHFSNPINTSKVATKFDDEDMHETFLLLKKDMAVITSVHMERLMKLRGKHLRAQSHLSQDSQSFYGDSKVLEYVDNVVENFLAMKLSKSVPSFDLLTSDKELLEKQCEENDDHMIYSSTSGRLPSTDLPGGLPGVCGGTITDLEWSQDSGVVRRSLSSGLCYLDESVHTKKNNNKKNMLPTYCREDERMAKSRPLVVCREYEKRANSRPPVVCREEGKLNDGRDCREDEKGAKRGRGEDCRSTLCSSAAGLLLFSF